MSRSGRDSNYRFESYTRVVLDVDGTLLLGDRALPGAVEFVDVIRSRELAVCFATNASFLSANQLIDNLQRAGIDARGGESVTAVDELGRRLLLQRGSAPIPFLGSGRAAAVLTHMGLSLVDPLECARGEKLALVVVAGLLPEVDARRVAKVADLLAPDTVVYCPNHEPGMPSADGLIPGSAAIVALMETHCLFPIPVATVGKPSAVFARAIDALVPTSGQTLLIGDGPDTDVEMARRMGWDSVLVDSNHGSHPGISTQAEFERSVSGLVVAHLRQLLAEVDW